MIHIHAIDEIRRVPRSGRSAAYLEKEVHRLEMLLKPVILFPSKWQLSCREAQTLAAVYVGDDRPVTRARLVYAIYGDKAPATADQCIKAYIFRLRVKLRAHHVRIVCMSKMGYRLDAWSREFVRKAIEEKSR